MDEWWDHEVRVAEAGKEPMQVTMALLHEYENADPATKDLIDIVLAEWALDKHPGKRFDALAAIEKYRVVKSADALEQLMQRLASDKSPEARDESKRARTILSRLRS